MFYKIPHHQWYKHHWSKKKIRKRKDSLEFILYSFPQFEWINVVKFHRCGAPSTRRTRCSEKKERREKRKKWRFRATLFLLRVIKRATRLIAGINRYPRRKIDHKIGQWCAIDTIRKWIRGLRGGSETRNRSFFLGPFTATRSVTRSREWYSWGDTHRAVTPTGRRGLLYL